MTARTALPANPFPAPERALPAPMRLDEYRIERVLAQSSFAVVYAAHDTALNLQVAIKEYLPDALALRGAELQVLPRSKAMAEQFERGRRAFIEEAQVLARCDHPALLHVTRILHRHDTVYRVMRPCPGPTLLAQRRDSAEAPTAQTVRDWLDALLGALQTLHGAGSVHGAVAPGNIVLGPANRPVLLDFEAVRTALISDRTQSMMTALEPCFAPIEQREPSKMTPLGPWTDLYSLAATLHFCISGQLPSAPAHDGSAAGFDALAALWQRRGVALDDDTAHLAACIDTCLAEWPQHRPQSVAALRALLGHRDTQAPVAAVPESRAQPAVAPAPADPAAVAAPKPSEVAAAVGADVRLDEQLIADLDQTFARIAAGAQDPSAPATAGVPAADGSNAGLDEAPSPPSPPSASVRLPTRIEPSLAAVPAMQALPDELWTPAPSAPGAFDDRPAAGLDSADGPPPSFLAPSKPRSWWWAGALAALVFAGGVFTFADWGPAEERTATTAPDKPAPAAPRADERAARPGVATGTPAEGGVPAKPVTTAPGEAVTNADTAAAPSANESLAPPASQDAPAPSTLPATAAGPAPAPDSGAAAPPSQAAAEPAPRRAAPRAPKVAAAPKTPVPAGPASPREVCGSRTQFSLYQCMQTQCASAKWSAHAQCVRLRNSDSVD